MITDVMFPTGVSSSKSSLENNWPLSLFFSYLSNKLIEDPYVIGLLIDNECYEDIHNFSYF